MTSIALFELVLAFTGAALVLTGLAGRTALPPAAALVVGGMALALTPGVPTFQIDPDLILVLLLPPLLMASAYYTVWRDFRAAMLPILLLAVGAVAFTTACVGYAAHLAAPAIPLAACFTLGAIVSPPDAVAAKAVLQRLKLPRRLVTILEGESLVNDASGLVLYGAAVAATATGSFDAQRELGRFVWLAAGGIAFGLAAGWAIVALLRRIHQAELAIALSLVSSWTVYVTADRLGVSGVLAVVTAGILFGIRQHDILDAGTRVSGAAVWQTVVYVLEALLFVLIGLALRGVLGQGGGQVLVRAFPVVAATVAAVVASRLAWVLLVAVLSQIASAWLRRERPRLSLLAPLAVGWAGMRGVVTLAVALALPAAFPARDQILIAAFAVILFTVLVQGTTLGPLIHAMHLRIVEGAGREPMDEATARVAAGRAGLSALEALVAQDGPEQPHLVEAYRRRLEAAGLRNEHAVAGRDLDVAAALAAVAASRAELMRLYRARQIHDSVLRVLEQEFDLEELQLRLAGKPIAR